MTTGSIDAPPSAPVRRHFGMNLNAFEDSSDLATQVGKPFLTNGKTPRLPSGGFIVTRPVTVRVTMTSSCSLVGPLLVSELQTPQQRDDEEQPRNPPVVTAGLSTSRSPGAGESQRRLKKESDFLFATDLGVKLVDRDPSAAGHGEIDTLPAPFKAFDQDKVAVRHDSRLVGTNTKLVPSRQRGLDAPIVGAIRVMGTHVRLAPRERLLGRCRPVNISLPGTTARNPPDFPKLAIQGPLSCQKLSQSPIFPGNNKLGQL